MESESIDFGLDIVFEEKVPIYNNCNKPNSKLSEISQKLFQDFNSKIKNIIDIYQGLLEENDKLKEENNKLKNLQNNVASFESDILKQKNLISPEKLIPLQENSFDSPIISRSFTLKKTDLKKKNSSSCNNTSDSGIIYKKKDFDENISSYIEDSLSFENDNSVKMLKKVKKTQPEYKFNKQNQSRIKKSLTFSNINLKASNIRQDTKNDKTASKIIPTVKIDISKFRKDGKKVNEENNDYENQKLKGKFNFKEENEIENFQTQITESQFTVNLDNFYFSSTPKKQFLDKKCIEDSYDVVPNRSPKIPDFPCKEPTVRKKNERILLKGYDCRDCANFYKIMESCPIKRQDMIQRCSRHRGHFNYDKDTPESFWNPDFTESISSTLNY